MWNYRIIKRQVEGQADQYGLFEVFYNDEGEISAHSEEPEVVGESPQDILDSLQIMLSDTKKHFDAFYPPKPNDKILEYGKIEFKPLYDEETTEDLSGLFEDFLNNEGKEKSHENN